jgi:antitoxin MazE
MRTSLHRIGNSQGVIIPKPLLAQIGLVKDVEMTVERDALLLRKPQPGMRAGWAEASKAIAASSEDALVWPEFGNEGDADFAW